MNLIEMIPQDLINFVLVSTFSFLIGLQQRSYHGEEEHQYLFGTDRTFTLLGIFGFILYVLSPFNLIPFMLGGLVFAFLLGIYYFQKIAIQKQFGMTSILAGLITYCLTPLVYLQPPWLVLTVVVTVLVLVEIKEDLFKFSKKIGNKEFTTLAKFIIIAGIVLPLLSNEPLTEFLHVSPYKIWLAIVVVSAISYLSYIIKKFIFPESGIILSAILGGLYSSTATTVILSKKSKENADPVKTAAGIMYATGIMYLRILILAYIFNRSIAMHLLPFFLILFAVTMAIGVQILRVKHGKKDSPVNPEADQNPLEFKAALIFGILFTVFGVLTKFILENYGSIGVGILSFVVGITDIDPYLLSLFQNSGTHLTVHIITMATIVATASNNLMKMGYAVFLGHPALKKPVIVGFLILVALSFLMLLFV
jgi:uncharacterized membrane protein (DUF4010 family)